MIIYPAIDIRGGRCVRLVEGRLDRETVYFDDPAEVAGVWEKKGAPWLHVVDLDGSFGGSPKNIEVVKRIREKVNIPIQLGGGIRDLETIERLLAIGINRVILGTVAVKNPDLVARAIEKFGAEAVVLGLDARDGKVAIEGWDITSEKSAVELALEMKALGVIRIIYTDISRDGTLQGVNIRGVAEMAEKTGISIIASGGVSTLEDLREVKKLFNTGVEGAIMGKSLYEKTVDLEDALKLAEGEPEAGQC